MAARIVQPLVKARVFGGLGNQCFIYAAARALADRVGGTLSLDSGLLAADAVYHRSLLLPEFDIRAASTAGLRTAGSLWVRRVQVRLPRLPCLSRRWLMEKIPRPFRHDLYAWRGRRVTLDGYWQSERYFSDDAAAIRKDLTPVQAADFEASPLASAIRAADHPVFLHVRSYREVPGRQDGSFALSRTYFANAIAHVCGQVRNPHFFLFSDDPAWALQRVFFPASVSCTAVTPDSMTAGSPLRDFHLMSLCRHAIVANSTFSWWAAWLGEQRRLRSSSGEIVRPPDCSANSDYYPPRWHAVAST